MILLGRGKLNLISNVLFYIINIDFYFRLEYQLEYCSPLDHPFSFNLTITLRYHDWR